MEYKRNNHLRLWSSVSQMSRISIKSSKYCNLLVSSHKEQLRCPFYVRRNPLNLTKCKNYIQLHFHLNHYASRSAYSYSALSQRYMECASNLIVYKKASISHWGTSVKEIVTTNVNGIYKSTVQWSEQTSPQQSHNNYMMHNYLMPLIGGRKKRCPNLLSDVVKYK